MDPVIAPTPSPDSSQKLPEFTGSPERGWKGEERAGNGCF